MSKMSDSDLQRKEAIDSLQGQRIEILEQIGAILDDKPAFIKKALEELHEKINIIDSQIHDIDATKL